MVGTAVAVEINDLGKSYGDHVAVEGVSLEVAAGEVCALLGPNGAGKTTTVECVSGFRVPDRGAVRVLGHDPVGERDAVMASLGVMLQEGGAYPGASPRELLSLHARFHRDPLGVDELLGRLGLGLVARTRYRQLSGGEKQRVGLALALVGRPRVAILDEPTAGLDPEARHLTWDLIRSLRDDGVTVLLTTHVMDEAERLADRVAILARGRLLANDTPGALLALHGQGGLSLITPARFDVAALSSAIGAPVADAGADRWTVAAPGAAEVARLMAAIPAWFADQQLPLTGITTGGEGLESVYLALVQRAFGESEQPALPERRDLPEASE